MNFAIDARTAKLMPLPYDAIELLVTPDFFSGRCLEAEEK